jgi:hypothetical protein
MSTSVLTPLQLIAGAGLLQNQGLIISPEMTAAITAYENTSLMTQFYLAQPYSPGLESVAANSVPAFSDAVPTAYVATLGDEMTTAVNDQAYTDLGSGDLSKFVQALNLAQAYGETTNIFLNSAVNSQTYLATTFTSTNNMITGDITSVNLATPAFGSDLANLGYLFDLSNLGDLGSPLALVQRLVSLTGNIPVLSFYFLAAGVPQDIVLNLTNPTATITDRVQKLMYEAMTVITDDALTQILKVLNITTPNINTMADLLNPVKLFPNSYQSLTVPTVNGLRAIYVNSAGAINTNLLSELPSYVIDRYNRLQQIIPADQALANQALGTSLGQVSGISLTTLPIFAQTIRALQTTQDLPLISALTEAVPASVANYYTNTLGDGTGDNNSILITDLLGTAIGWISTDALGNTVATFADMNLAYLKTIYQTMTNTVNGQYDSGNGVIVIPSGTPAAGEYTTIDLAFEGEPAGNVLGGPGLITVASAEISNIVTAYPTQVGSLNQDWNAMSQQLILENTLQSEADLNYANLTANQRNSMYGFIFNLPSYGLDITEGGTAQFIEGVANLATFTGQAVVACLREGRNQDALSFSGIYTNSNVPADPNPPPPSANLIPSTYSESEAANLVIK